MIKNYLLLISIFIISCSVICSCKKNKEIINNKCNSYQAPDDTYKYPILPGTQQWIDLQTTEARWAACQIPQNLLPTMSTEGLVESWLTMPLNNNIYVTNSIQKAMEWFIQNFSGLHELVNRDDAAEKSFSRYKSLLPSCVASYNTEDKQGGFTFLFTYNGLVLAQDIVINQMNHELRKQLVAEAIKKFYEQKDDYYYYFGYPSLEICCFICAKAMNNSQYLPFLSQLNYNLVFFLENAQFPSPANPYNEEMSVIISSAKSFINS